MFVSPKKVSPDRNLPAALVCGTEYGSWLPKKRSRFLLGKKQGMKQKVHAPVQPREAVLPRHEQVQAEIRSFILAMNSYPARVAKEPRVSFRQHLSGFYRIVSEHRASRGRRD